MRFHITIKGSILHFQRTSNRQLEATNLIIQKNTVTRCLHHLQKNIRLLYHTKIYFELTTPPLSNYRVDESDHTFRRACSPVKIDHQNTTPRAGHVGYDRGQTKQTGLKPNSPLFYAKLAGIKWEEAERLAQQYTHRMDLILYCYCSYKHYVECS